MKLHTYKRLPPRGCHTSVMGATSLRDATLFVKYPTGHYVYLVATSKTSVFSPYPGGLCIREYGPNWELWHSSESEGK
jgi:hypothetical protein